MPYKDIHNNPIPPARNPYVSSGSAMSVVDQVDQNSASLISPEIIELLASHKISADEYDAFIEKYCLRASGKPSVGYRESGALTCHHYSCPNNTLPFFHKSSQNWEPLFRNSQTPSATRYKQG